MSDTPGILIERLGAFGDTEELSEWLLQRAEQDAYTSADRYYLKEVEASLSGLYDLAERMAKILEEKGSEK